MVRLFQSLAERYGPRKALCHKVEGRDEECFTYDDLAERSATFANHLIELGIEAEDRIAILCEPRPRWSVALFSILTARAIAVPLDTRSTLEELQAIVADAKPRMLLVSSQTAALGRQLQQACPEIEYLFSLESADSNDGLRCIDELSAEREHPGRVSDFDDPAILTYTSGTTGQPKGVVTTHGNLLFQIHAFRQTMGKHADDARVVSILPLNHLFELSVGLLGVLDGGGRICYVNSLMPHEILAAMREHQVTCMVTVPLFLKLLRNGILREVETKPHWQRRMFKALLQVAAVLPRHIRRRLFHRVHDQFGAHLDYFICGGAPLESEVQQFFERIGIAVYQGYGMAEASPVISTNTPEFNRPGSVGRALPGVELKIVDVEHGCGEILTRGAHVMQSYYRSRSLTRQAIDEEGWLHTGDLGFLDAQDYLHICGRKKNVIVLGSGKNVQPEELEDIIFAHPDIREGCVLGAPSTQGIATGSEEVCAVVVPSDELLSRYLDRKHEVVRHLHAIVQQNSRAFAPWKRPSRVVIDCTGLPRTSTRKVRRQAVSAWLESQSAQS